MILKINSLEDIVNYIKYINNNTNIIGTWEYWMGY